MQPDTEHLKQWIGKTQSRSELAAATPLQALTATLDREDPAPQIGDDIPPGWHWLYFLPMHPQSEIGPDGHAKRGDFLPPISLPRRMWAGSRLEFPKPLRLGDVISRTSRIADVTCKQGSTGALVFVRVRHELSDAAGVSTIEEQDIVYRESARPEDPMPTPRPAPQEHEWIREIRPDPVLLFRYSALTFNAHRIHYDRPYATDVEGYPGLVVHGPLIATLLLDLIRRSCPDASVSSFAFRAIKPLFDSGPFFVCGRDKGHANTIDLWAKDGSDFLAMEATATLR